MVWEGPVHREGRVGLGGSLEVSSDTDRGGQTKLESWLWDLG